MMNRRQLIGRLAAGLGAVGVGLPSMARAQSAADQKLVIVLAYGGWDPVWVFDPKPEWADGDRPPGDVRMFGDLPIWVDGQRPAVTRFFEQWGARSAVVNGLSVKSLAHETCIHVMLTGQSRGHRPDLGARIAGALGGDRALPYLALAPHARTTGHDAIVGELGVTNQLMGLSTRPFGWPRPGAIDGDAGLGPNRAERAAIDAYLHAVTEDTGARRHSPRSARMLADYAASLPRADALMDAARAGGFLSDFALFQDTSAPWRHVAAALAEGVSQVALVQPDVYWDTHAYNATQGGNHETFFTGLVALMDALVERELTENTTVLVISEMGRTPQLNAQQGKDHWPWTSAMVVGPRVMGGRAFGQTDTWLRPRPLDLGTGAVDANGVDLHPEHLLGAVARMMNVDRPDWYDREAFDALVG